MAPVILTIPMPPSTNELYSGRRFKTERYKAWIVEAGWELKRQRPQPIVGAYTLDIKLPGRCDLDNIKAIPDLLVTMCLVAGDRRRYMRRVTIEPTDGPLTVTITPVPC